MLPSRHGPYQAGTGDYGTWDARATIAGYTKRVFVARSPPAVQHTQLAIKHALSGHPGPVAVLYHSGALTQTVGPHHATAVRHPGVPLQRAAIRQRREHHKALELLNQAQQPVIIAGNGVRMSHAQAQLRELAELLGIPVATTASGKGVFPETHPLALGVFGNFGLDAANAVVAAADLVLAVGTSSAPPTPPTRTRRCSTPSVRPLCRWTSKACTPPGPCLRPRPWWVMHSGC